MEIQMDSLQKMIKAACTDMGDEAGFRNDYSGRGMYGKRCVGITGTWKDCQRVIAAVLGNLTQELFDASIDCDEGEENVAYDLNDKTQTAIDQLMNFSFDQMGYDVIIYWERLEPLTEEELSEDDNLPTDAELDAMDPHALVQWVVKQAPTYKSGDDDVETIDALRVTAKAMRDRIREDQQ
jgi:hypothetical protein